MMRYIEQTKLSIPMQKREDLAENWPENWHFYFKVTLWLRHKSERAHFAKSSRFFATEALYNVSEVPLLPNSF